jgi:hypothetical protein
MNETPRPGGTYNNARAANDQQTHTVVGPKSNERARGHNQMQGKPNMKAFVQPRSGITKTQGHVGLRGLGPVLGTYPPIGGRDLDQPWK